LKPLYIKTLVALLLFSAYFQAFANNKHAYVNGALSLISFNPMSAKAGDTVQITGTGFSGITSVSFGGVPVTSFAVTSPTTIRAYVGVGNSGNVYVAAGAAVDSLSGFVYQSAPLIQSVSPAQGYLGDTLYFHGQNLIGVTRIDFGGVDASYTVVSDSLIMARVAGWAPVIEFFKTAGSNVYVTSFMGFTFLDSTSPAIVSFTPETAYINQPVTIRGRRFTNATKVQFGTTQISPFTIVSDSVIIANPVHGSSSGNVYVTTDKGTAALGGFYFLDYVPLVFSSFSPASAKTGDVVTIRGAVMLDVNGVYFGGTPAMSFTKLSDSVITAVVGEGSSGNIVLTADWNGTDSLPGFTYFTLGPTPTVLSFTPNNGSEGTLVQISGHHFSNATAVNFGENGADSFKIISDSVIDAFVGGCCSGNVDVINAAGTGSLEGFTYNYPPPPPPDTGYVIAKFNATVENGNAVVSWEIVNEAGIGNFIVQRAPDSVSFVPLDSVAPINNWGTNDYSATDAHMLNGLNNYRLEVVDTLGNIRYSIIVTIINQSNNPNVNTHTIKLYPNPTTGNFTVDYPSSADQSSITILDMMGKTLKTINVQANSTATKIYLNNTYQGIYRVVWTDGKTTTSRNLLIQSH
jgi:Secretion system C-terminal sorting domain/IPT/TIG domain